MKWRREKNIERNRRQDTGRCLKKTQTNEQYQREDSLAHAAGLWDTQKVQQWAKLGVRPFTLFLMAFKVDASVTFSSSSVF